VGAADKDETGMANFDFDMVVKIGSIAMVRKADGDIDYNILSRLARELKPGYILVTSGAGEIGRIDYMQRNGGRGLKGGEEEIKTTYCAQGQPILMETYRRFVSPQYSIRQVLVEHSHFNDEKKAAHIKDLLFSAANQNAIPIVNYNDAVSSTETIKFELSRLKKKRYNVTDYVENDETAVVITRLAGARLLVMLSDIDGVYLGPDAPVRDVTANSFEEMSEKIDGLISSCGDPSDPGALKLNYVRQALGCGATVIVANAKNSLSDILGGHVPRSYFCVN
jgi:glutamate 5-kinase